MTGAKKLVIGASGFLGSDVTRQLFDRGDVFYCVVDTRAWPRDPLPLFRTNVEGLRHVLDAAVDTDLRRLAFTSTIGTIGIPAGPPSPFRRNDSAAKTSSGLRMPSSDIGFKINVWPKNSR